MKAVPEANMYEQMEMFDFIKEPQESEVPESKTLFESLFIKIKNPVMWCANCLCGRCANNAEADLRKVRPDEQKEPCFNCDKCWQYTGGSLRKGQRLEDCERFVLSDYSAAGKRRKIKIVK